MSSEDKNMVEGTVHTSQAHAQYPEKASKKLLRKMKENPFVPAGLLLTAGALGWGAYTYKDARASGVSKSLFFMQLRVKSQSMVVGAMTLGVAYALLRDYIWHPKSQEEIHEMYKHPYGSHNGK